MIKLTSGFLIESDTNQPVKVANNCLKYQFEVKMRNATIRLAKRKALINCTLTTLQISYTFVSQESVTIWPVYAYTLAAQNTVIKLLMLILYVEDNTSMSYEEIHA